MLEKRKFRRFMLGAEVRWKNEASVDDGTKPFERMTRDLSTGGVCLDLQTGVGVGDTLLLEIMLPGNQSIYSRGRVAWVNTQAQIKSWTIPACEGGVEFLNLSESEKAAIDRFISQSLQT